MLKWEKNYIQKIEICKNSDRVNIYEIHQVFLQNSYKVIVWLKQPHLMLYKNFDKTFNTIDDAKKACEIYEQNGLWV